MPEAAANALQKVHSLDGNPVHFRHRYPRRPPRRNFQGQLVSGVPPDPSWATSPSMPPHAAIQQHLGGAGALAFLNGLGLGFELVELALFVPLLLIIKRV